MYKKLIYACNYAGSYVNSKLENRKILYGVLGAYFLIILLCSSLIRFSVYSPDSWAYFELSKTIFSENFYKFNTFRSYFSNEYSTSFPFGWPIIIALTSAVTVENPLVAIYINIILAIAIAMILFRVCRTLTLPTISALALTAALLFYRPFVDEIYAGRAMPLALMLLLMSIYLIQKEYIFLAGIALGFSAIVRFDYLLFGVILIVIFILNDRSKSFFSLFIGFVCGLLPWTVYSYTHFQKFWISDNSWIATAVARAYVVDYPAFAKTTVFQEPGLWLLRIAGNIPRLAWSLLKSALFYPAFILVAAFLFLNYSKFLREVGWKYKFSLLVIVIGLSAYLLTGYFDSRYYSLFFCTETVLLFIALQSLDRVNLLGLDLHGLSFLCLMCTLLIGLANLSHNTYSAIEKRDKFTKNSALIDKIYACHRLEPNTTYILSDELTFLLPRYGAQTSLPAAMLPSNYLRMTGAEKDNYFAYMRPYRWIKEFSQIHSCGQS